MVNAADNQLEMAEYALRLGDDALILAQRQCEWCAAAPTLEEDIAIANVALDYFGRARMLLDYAGQTLGKSEDELAYLRDAFEFKNLLIVELPRGDFAFSMVRHYLLDEFELLFFSELAHSVNPQLAAIAQKSLKEIRYHHRRSREWMRRLGLGTAESNTRAQAAVDELWGYVGELFAMDDLETGLHAAQVSVDRSALRDPWQQTVTQCLAEVELSQPLDDWQVGGGREGVHTEHLGHMLSEMQYLQRVYPGQTW